ncbi:MAG TPA: transposase [Sphaerochaeta sp.]|nr:transposase [Sphaerochaeta sp.]
MYLHTDKRSGLVMEITSYRVPGGKYPLQDKVYIGRVDENGVFVPNKFFIERSKKEELQGEVSRLQEELDAMGKGEKKQSKEVKALTKVVTSVSGKKKAGLTYALHHIATVEGFVAALYALFGDKKADLILSLSYYVLVTKNEALDDFWDFDLSHVHPCGRDISSSESSAILASITEEHVNEFFKILRKANPTRSKEDHFCAFDGTAFSSYSNDLSEVEVSKGKQDPDLKHFAMAAVYSSLERRCVYYRIYRGNIPDSKTIDNFVDVAKAMGYNFSRVALDRGYCSWNNLLRLHHECRYNVIMCIKSNMTVYKDSLESVKGSFEEDCTLYLSQHGVYAKTVRQEIVLTDDKKKEYPTKVHVHVYYSRMKAADQEPKLYGELEDSITSLTEKVADKELSVKDAQQRLFACKHKSLISVRKTGNSTCVFEMDTKAVDEARGKLGYFMLLSTEDLSAGQVLDIYRAKDGVERVFNNAKNDIGFDRPAVKTDATLQGKVFIIMLAGMISTVIRNRMRAHRKELTRKTTYNKVLKELSCMYTFEIKGKTTWCEVSERQELILTCLDVPLPVEPKKVTAKLKKKRGPKPKA